MRYLNAAQFEQLVKTRWPTKGRRLREARHAWYLDGRKPNRRDLFAMTQALEWDDADIAQLLIDVRDYLAVIDTPGLKRYKMQFSRFLLDERARAPDAWWRLLH